MQDCSISSALGGVLGQVSDRDAPHRPSTQNATRVKKGGRNIFPNFDEK